jgi:hypothetical protein
MIVPRYENTGKRTICVNAKEVVQSIRHSFPTESYQDLANRAQVNIQSVFRWLSTDRADKQTIRRLLASFDLEVNTDNVLLKDATPTQLFKQCQVIGWDKVINSMQGFQ